MISFKCSHNFTKYKCVKQHSSHHNLGQLSTEYAASTKIYVEHKSDF